MLGILWKQVTLNPGDPKHSSVPFPAESGLQLLIFCMASSSHPGCHVYLQQRKDELIWTGQHDYKLVPTFPAVEMSLLSGGCAEPLRFGISPAVTACIQGTAKEELN